MPRNQQLTVFGFAVGGSSARLRQRFAQFSAALAKQVGGEVALFEASSYGELASAVVSQYVDLAWLPPIPFVALERQRAVVPLVHLRCGVSVRAWTSGRCPAVRQ